MSKPLVSDALWAMVEPLLPPPRPHPKGGRPAIANRAALTGILFVLRSGIPWEMLPQDGLRLRDELLAPPARLAASRRLGPAARTDAAKARRCRPHRLEPRLPRQPLGGREKGGAETGPNPTDRGKAGTKHHIVVDRAGTPLVGLIGSANRHDSLMLAPALDAVPPIRGRRGRPRRRPDRLHADKAYDHRRCRDACRKRHIRPRIARRGIDSRERLGRHRWVVEPTIAWLHRFRRLATRYERRAELHQAFLTLGCAIVCYNQLIRLC